MFTKQTPVSIPSERDSSQCLAACQVAASGSGKTIRRSIRQNPGDSLPMTEQ
jgi:hypothetical protein